MTPLGNAEVSYKAHTGIAATQVDMDAPSDNDEYKQLSMSPEVYV